MSADENADILEIESNTSQNPEVLQESGFKMEEVFSTAFDVSNGFKWTVQKILFLAFLAYLPMIAIQLGFEYLANGFDPDIEITFKSFSLQLAGELLLTLLSTPLMAGISMLALKRARAKEVKASEVFAYYPKIIPLFITVVLMYLMIILGFALFILPGIYLGVAYYFAILLVVDKGLSPWQALETSRKRVTKYWFKVFASFLVVSLFILISIIPLGIGLIWSIPWSMLVFALIYLKLFPDNPT